MRGNVAERATGRSVGQRSHKTVGRADAEEMFHQPGVTSETAGRGLHAASLSVSQQGRQIGWPGETQPDRILNAVVTQPPHPGDDGTTVEAELCNNVDGKPALLRRFDLCLQGPIEHIV